MTREEIGALIIRSEDKMYHVAKTLLRGDEDCMDAIQEAIVKAFAKVDTLRVDAYASTWLIRILINECYSIMKREKRLVSLEDYTQEERAEEREDYSELYQAISRLPEQVRLSVVLYYLEGYSVKEIAELMDTTEGAVKNRLQRARKRLRIELEQEAVE